MGETVEVTGAGPDGPEAPVPPEGPVFAPVLPGAAVGPAVPVGSLMLAWVPEVPTVGFGVPAGLPDSPSVHPSAKQVTRVVVRLVIRSRIFRSGNGCVRGANAARLDNGVHRARRAIPAFSSVWSRWPRLETLSSRGLRSGTPTSLAPQASC